MRIEQYASTIKDCRFCWMCRHICPVARETAKETNTTRGKALTLWTVLAGMTDFGDKDIVQTIYECALCETCKSACVTGRDMPEVIIAARADIVEQGKAPEAVQKAAESLAGLDNPWGKPREERAVKLKKQIVALPQEAEVLLYLGCSTSYLHPEVAAAAINLLKKAGVNFTVLKDEGCCGLPLLRLGYREEARSKAITNLELIKKSNCKTVVTLCASCYSAFRQDYMDLGLSFEPAVRVLHSSEFLAELLQQGVLKPQSEFKQTITFHDPCILARKFGQVDAPRQVLAAIPGLEVDEMHWNREETRCCGSSLLHLLYPELAGKIAATRIGEAMETGADVLVTTCPGCKENLSKSGAMTVLELNELLLKVT